MALYSIGIFGYAYLLCGSFQFLLFDFKVMFFRFEKSEVGFPELFITLICPADFGLKFDFNGFESIFDAASSIFLF